MKAPERLDRLAFSLSNACHILVDDSCRVAGWIPRWSLTQNDVSKSPLRQDMYIAFRSACWFATWARTDRDDLGDFRNSSRSKDERRFGDAPMQELSPLSHRFRSILRAKICILLLLRDIRTGHTVLGSLQRDRRLWESLTADSNALAWQVSLV